MADKPTKTSKPRKAAAKPAAATRTAAAEAAPATTTEAAPGTAVIKIDKDKHGGVVRGAVNGQRYELRTGADVTVTEGQLQSLRDSYVDFSIVTPLAGEDAAEGSAASSTITGTATRLEPAVQVPPVGEDGQPQPAPELRQVTDEELTKGSQEASRDQAETDGGEQGTGGATIDKTAPTATTTEATKP